MNIHKNARLTPAGRERIVRQVESGQTPEAGTSRRRLPADRAKWVGRYRREGLAGLARSLIAAAPTVSANPAGHCRASRAAAASALHRQADRRRVAHLAGHRQPRPQTPGPQ